MSCTLPSSRTCVWQCEPAPRRRGPPPADSLRALEHRRKGRVRVQSWELVGLARKSHLDQMVRKRDPTSRIGIRPGGAALRRVRAREMRNEGRSVRAASCTTSEKNIYVGSQQSCELPTNQNNELCICNENFSGLKFSEWCKFPIGTNGRLRPVAVLAEGEFDALKLTLNVYTRCPSWGCRDAATREILHPTARIADAIQLGSSRPWARDLPQREQGKDSEHRRTP